MSHVTYLIFLIFLNVKQMMNSTFFHHLEFFFFFDFFRPREKFLLLIMKTSRKFSERVNDYEGVAKKIRDE